MLKSLAAMIQTAFYSVGEFSQTLTETLSTCSMRWKQMLFNGCLSSKWIYDDQDGDDHDHNHQDDVYDDQDNHNDHQQTAVCLFTTGSLQIKSNHGLLPKRESIMMMMMISAIIMGDHNITMIITMNWISEWCLLRWQWLKAYQMCIMNI